jgi:hypothetical protein
MESPPSSTSSFGTAETPVRVEQSTPSTPRAVSFPHQTPYADTLPLPFPPAKRKIGTFALALPPSLATPSRHASLSYFTETGEVELEDVAVSGKLRARDKMESESTSANLVSSPSLQTSDPSLPPQWCARACTCACAVRACVCVCSRAQGQELRTEQTVSF